MIFHVCNVGVPEFNGWKKISSYPELLAGDEPANTVWLINTSLDWSNSKQSSFYGFDVAKLIRLEKKSKAPIIFYSAVPQAYFEEKSKKEIKFRILFGRGSAFIEAPFKEAQITELASSINPLSNAALHDVVTMLCDIKGVVVDKLNHDLKFGVDISSVISSIRPYLSSLQMQEIKLSEFTEKLQQASDEKNSHEFFSIKQMFIKRCNLHLNDFGESVNEAREVKYKILVIDDKVDELEKMRINLPANLFDIIPVCQAEDAIEEIRKDTSNKISAIVSDWRLYEKGVQNYWQTLQGYEILDFASKNGIRALFALTSQADFVVHHLRNLMGIRFSMFKKENLVSTGQWNVFVDILYESCEHAVKLRASLPDDAAQWTKEIIKNGEPLKTLKQQYIEGWNSEDRDNYFSKITTIADQIWEYLKQTPNNSSLVSEFGIELPSKVLVLEPILIYRRIWLALWFSNASVGVRLSKESISKYSEEIYKRMFSPGNKRKMTTSASQNAFKLCIEIYKIQQGKILPEEREWLISHGLLE